MDDMNTKQMNPTKESNGDLCEIAMNCCSRGAASLSNFPGLMKEIIETKAWERREWRGKVFELPSLLDLITRKPLEGWGEDPEKVEALIESDPEVLSMWRKETTRANHRPLKSNDNIITSSKAKQGTGKAYTLDRLSKENPDLYQSVVNGELSANAAAIAAGWRKKTVTVTDDPASAAKTLREKFGDEWFKAMVQEAGMELDPVKAKAPKVKPQAKRSKEKPRPQKTKPAKPAEAKPKSGSKSKIIIKPEFKKLPILTYQRWYTEQLEEDLKNNGCKDPLIVQQGSNILVDGYKRHEICERLKIPFHVQYDYYESLEEMATDIVLGDAETFKNYYDPSHENIYKMHLREIVAGTFERMGLSEEVSVNACQGALKILGIIDG
jgi:hypothetical protein